MEPRTVAGSAVDADAATIGDGRIIKTVSKIEKNCFAFIFSIRFPFSSKVAKYFPGYYTETPFYVSRKKIALQPIDFKLEESYTLKATSPMRRRTKRVDSTACRETVQKSLASRAALRGGASQDEGALRRRNWPWK